MSGPAIDSPATPDDLSPRPGAAVDAAEPRRVPTWLLAAVLLASFGGTSHVYPHWKETNTASRLYLTLAIIDGHALTIDGPLSRYGDTQDKAVHDGRFYSDKAPGFSFLLAPAAWLLRVLLIPQDDYVQMARWLRIVGVVLPAAAFWIVVRPYFDRLTGGSRGAAVIAAVALGSGLTIYSGQLFSHAPAGMLLFLAWLALREAAAATGSAAGWQAVRAGLLAGVAFTVDYLALPGMAILAGAAAWLGGDRLRRAALVAAGMAPPLAMWMAYNAVCFGHPLTTGFEQHADATYGPAYRAGWHGMHAPSFDALLGLTLSPARGLFYYSPVLVLAVGGWLGLIADRETRRDGVVSLLIVLGTLAFATTTVDWRGGWAFGPRYLVPALPFAAVGLAGALRPAAHSWLAAPLFFGLSWAGIVTTSLASATFPFFPPEFFNPLKSLAAELFFAGQRAPTFLHAISTTFDAIWPLGVLLAAVWIVYRAVESALPRPLSQRWALVLGSLVIAEALQGWQASFAEPPEGATVRSVLKADVLMRMDELVAAHETLLSVPAGPAAAVPASADRPRPSGNPLPEEPQ